MTDEGTFEHGASVLRLARDVDDAGPEVVAAVARGTRPAARGPGRAAAAGARRQGRRRLERAGDHRAGRARLRDRRAVESADRGGTGGDRCSPTVHVVDGRLRRVSRDGTVGEPAGVLEDYGAVAEAFCAVHQLTGEGRWLDLAGELLDAALAHFRDRRGRLLRHRRRRRGADRPAGRPDRQRDPVRAVRARGGAGRLRARCAASRATGRRPRRRWPRSRRSPTATPASPGTRPRSARRCCPARTRSRS